MAAIGTEKEILYKKYRKTQDAVTIDKNEVKKLNRAFTPLGRIASFVFVIIFIVAIWKFTERSHEWFLLGGMMLIFLLFKTFFALIYRPYKKELTKDYKVSIIITCFNENPTSVVSIFENILELDYPVQEILFLDDGSKDTTAFEVAKSFAETHQDLQRTPSFKIIRFEENRGKREVLIEGFKRASGDYVFLLDSDSEILPNSLTELLRPFENKKTTSCVGNIGILNKNENFLTRMQSVSYFGAFQLGRAAQSLTGDVTVCSGAFSIHKREFILNNIEDFMHYCLFKVCVSAGDDRAITGFSKLAGGKTRYQNTAYCETDAPNTWRKFQSQRRRWQRSAYIGSLISIRNMFPKKLLYLFWAFSEAYFWLIAVIIFIISIITKGLYIDMVDIILYYIFIMYIQNVFYLFYKPIRFLLSPIYFLVYGLSLTFTRIHAIVTINNDTWGTRGAAKKK